MSSAFRPQPLLLTLNAGSASLKFALFAGGDPLRRIFHGTFERQADGRVTRRLEDLMAGAREETPAETATVREQVLEIAALLEKRPGGAKPEAIGQRIVHGGLRHTAHTLLDDAALRDLEAARILDPEHLPAALEGIAAMREAFPGVPQALCFDTVFHRDLPEAARTLPIPRRLTSDGLRRFGFHGLSYSYLLGELRRQAGAAADGRVILAHLGNGASLAAVLAGRCIDTTMSLTSTAGLVMGTRSGDLDPGLAGYLSASEGMTAADFSLMASHESGLLGISGLSADVRALLAAESANPAAANALAVFVLQARKFIGALAASLGGLDTLVFSGGIGEHSAVLRARIAAHLEFLGVRIDPDANARGAALISPPGAPVAVRVIPTDEEHFIAETTLDLLRKHQP